MAIALRFQIAGALCAATLLNLSHHSAVRGTEHSTWIALGDGNWFDAANWDGPVPNAPGDIALMTRIGSEDVSVALPAQATLGSMFMPGPSSFIFAGTGPLFFDNPGGEDAIFTVLTQAQHHRLDVPLGIAAGQQLILDVPENNSVTLQGGITQESGDLVKRNTGTLRLPAASPDWGGHLRLEAGMVLPTHADAFGNSSGSTTIDGATVKIAEVLAEPFVLQAGILETTTHFLDLDSHLTLPSGNTATVHGPFRIRGGTSGAGTLRLVATEFAATNASDAPLAHQGGLVITSGETDPQFATLESDNTYSGHTEVTDVTLDVRTANGLGSPDDGTSVTNGVLKLHGGSMESVHAQNSTLALWSAETTIAELRATGTLTLNSSTLSTHARFRSAEVYAVQQPVVLEGGSNRVETDRGAIRLEGGVVGHGDLMFNPHRFHPVEVADRIDITGGLEIRGGPVHLTAPNAYSGSLLLRNAGRLIVDAEQTLDHIMTPAKDSSCCSPSGAVQVSPGISLNANSVNIFQGLIQGNVQTPGPIEFHGFAGNRTVSHLESGVDVHLMGGQLTVDDSDAGRSPTNGTVSVLRKSEASILLLRDTVTDANLALNNGTGFNFGGALRTEAELGAQAITVRGTIDLGTDGAHIGGWDSITVEGPLVGGDLHLGQNRATPTLILNKDTIGYTGKTAIHSGTIRLEGQGTLNNTSGIDVFSDGTLAVVNSPADGLSAGRIADSIPIVLHGGDVSVSEPGVRRERVDQVHAARGLSTVDGLVAGQLNRAPGAVVAIRPQSVTPFVLENLPPVTHGILPPWILSSLSQFATTDADGLQRYEGPITPLLQSDSTSIVKPESSLLDHDRVIHAWSSFGTAPSVDMDGHTLTVGSGGLIGAKLSNGTLLPGEHANGELVIAYSTIDADIADNGQPTSVVYTSSAEVGGNNSYSGTTYLVAKPGDRVEFTRPSALPVGGDIEVSGWAELDLSENSGNAAYQFGRVVLRDAATLSVRCCNGDTFTADEVELEGGRLAAKLTGDFPIHKRTNGLAILSSNSPDFTGRVDIHEGTLALGEGADDGFLAVGAGKVAVHPGARLVLPPVPELAIDSSPSPTVELAGGALFGVGIFKDDTFNLTGTLEVSEDSYIYLLDGFEPVPRNADITIDGQIQIHDGKSLAVISIFPNLELSVSEGFQFGHGSVLAGNGSILAHVNVSDSAILSPGLPTDQVTVGFLNVSVPSRFPDFEKSKLIWGEGGRYRWEINSASGLPGAPFGEGWDLVNAGPELLIESTPENPFVIEIVGLGLDGGPGRVADLIPHVPYRWTIAEAAQLNAFTGEIIGFDPTKFAVDISSLQESYPHVRAEDFWLEQDGRFIYLNGVVVPEPNTALLLVGLVCLVLLAHRPARFSLYSTYKQTRLCTDSRRMP